jgi:hypothetical protein
MTKTLLEILKGLPYDPSLAVELYKQLYESMFIALIDQGTENNINTMAFLTYPTEDGTRELQIFTDSSYVLELDKEKSCTVEIPGHLLWPRLLQIIESEVCEVAVDPGQEHGIRLNKNMILGMVSKYRVKDK